MILRKKLKELNKNKSGLNVDYSIVDAYKKIKERNKNTKRILEGISNVDQQSELDQLNKELESVGETKNIRKIFED